MNAHKYATLRDAGIIASAIPSYSMLERAITGGSNIKEKMGYPEKLDPAEDILSKVAGAEPETGNIFFKTLCKQSGGVYRYQEALGLAKKLPLSHELMPGKEHLQEAMFLPDAGAKSYLFAHYAIIGPNVHIQLMHPGFPEEYKPRARIEVPWDKPDLMLKALKQAVVEHQLSPRETAALASSLSHASYLHYTHSGGGELHSSLENVASQIAEDFEQLALAYANEDKAAQARIEQKHEAVNLGFRAVTELPGRIIKGMGFGKEKGSKGGEVVKLHPDRDEASRAL